MPYLTDYNGLQVLMPDPTETGGLAINNNFKALSTFISTSNPGVDDDSTQGFSIGSRWYNSATSAEWVCLGASPGAANWVTINSLVLAGFLPLTGGTLSGPLVAAATTASSLSVSGNSILHAATASTLATSGAATFASGAASIDASGNAQFGVITAAGMVSIGGDLLGPTSATLCNGNVRFDTSGNLNLNNGSLNVLNGSMYVDGGISVGTTYSGYYLNLQGQVLLNGNTGSGYFAGGISANSGLTISGSTTLDGGNVSTDGSGNLTCISVNLSGGGIGNGAFLIDYPGNASFSGSLIAGAGNFIVDGTGVATLGQGLIIPNSGFSSTLDGGFITTDGSGNVSAISVSLSGAFSVAGATTLDSGNISTDGSGSISMNGGTIELNGGGVFEADLGYGGGGGAFFVGFTTTLDGGAITTDGSGNLHAASAGFGNGLSVGSTTTLDNGQINTDGNGNMSLATTIFATSTAPASPQPGQIYFDGTHWYGWNGSAWKQLDN